MALRTVLGELKLPLTPAAPVALAPGTYQSGPIANAGYAQFVEILVHITAVSGASPTLVVSLESSPDRVTWTAIPGTATASLTAVGNARTCAWVNDEFVRITSTVGGSATTVTYAVAAVVVPE